MTTAHTSTTFERRVRLQPARKPACLRVRWSVAAVALGRPGRKPARLELQLRPSEGAQVMLDGQPLDAAGTWCARWDGRLDVRRVASGPGRGLLIVEAAPLVVAVLGALDDERPLHVACDLPAVLGLAGGRYELVGGELVP